MPPLVQPEAAKSQDDIMSAKYKRVFLSPTGKEVLDHLRQMVYGNPVKNDYQPWRIIGQQDIVKHIGEVIDG
ncbi:MAG: hypothetical protein IIB19_07855 [Chloroflexi bacterium]|nr:hypothetical protein [Chloroflexota bacterium]